MPGKKSHLAPALALTLAACSANPTPSPQTPETQSSHQAIMHQIDETREQIRQIEALNRVEFGNLTVGSFSDKPEEKWQNFDQSYGFKQVCDMQARSLHPAIATLTNQVIDDPALKKACPPNLPEDKWSTCYDSQIQVLLPPQKALVYWQEVLKMKEESLTCLSQKASHRAEQLNHWTQQ